MSAQNHLLRAALAYASRGWPVFPCNPKNKAPLVKADCDAAGNEIPDSGGVKKASIDPDVIHGWWQEWPRAMPALACGRVAGVFVLDFDVEDDPEGAKLAALIAALEQELGVKLPATWEAATPRGGRHRYYEMPAGEAIGNRTALLGKGSHIDVRGEGGYVILPPATRPDGKGYAWVEGFAPAGKDAQPAKAPAELHACILRSGKWASEPASRATHEPERARPRPSLRLVSGTDGTFARDTPGEAAVRRYALAALDGEVRRLKESVEGQRNDDLFHASIKVAQLVAAGALDESRARAVLEGAAARWPNVRKSRGTIESGWRKGLNEPRPEIDEVRANAEARAARAHAGLSGAAARPLAAAPPPDFSGADGPVPTSGHQLRPRRKPVGNGGRLPPDERARQVALNGKLAFFPMTDLGNAERFAERCNGRLLWCPALGWLWWDGRRWASEGAAGKVKIAEHETVRAILDEAEWLAQSGRDKVMGSRGKGDDKQDVLLSDLLRAWGRESEAARRLSPIAKHAAPYLEVAPTEFDADPFKINVRNGTLHVRRAADGLTIAFNPHDPADRITKIIPVDYDPAAQCPIYDGFLAAAQPHAAVRRFLHQWGGLSLTGDVSEQRVVLFLGTGQNGKTTLIEIWAYVAGDYGCSVPIETFINEGRGRSAGQATPDLAMLKSVRYAYTDEPKKQGRLAEGLVKSLTGGNALQVRELSKPYFRLKPSFKLTISGNFKPRIEGGSRTHGIWRRITLVPWTWVVPEGKKDKALPEKLQAEAAGILNRLLDGLRDWLDNGLVLPDEVVEATEKYRSDSDPLGRFLTTCTRPDGAGRISSSELYRLFVAWAKANGEREWTQNGLGRAMSDSGRESQHSGGSWWVGLRAIKSERDFVDEHGHPLRSFAVGAAEDVHDDEIVLP
jgi:putative DNA primase/helicase